MSLQDFIFLPLMVFLANFLVGYILLALFAFFRKSIW